MSEDTPDDEIRVGNPERERAAALLSSALTDGYLDIQEFDERSAALYAAKNRRELRAVLEQLPGENQLFGSAEHVSAGPALPSGTDSVEFDISWKSVTRKGRWPVPARLLVTGSMGTADLDFSQVTLPAGGVVVDVQISASTLKVKVSGDQSVQFDQLQCSGWSSVKDRTGSARPASGLTIVLRGALSGGSSAVLRRV